MNLRTIPEIARRFGVVTGLSDHTLGTTVAVASLGLGVSVIEKHFTLSRRDGGPDADFSLEPHELKQLVSSVREAEQALGTSTFEIGEREAENLVFRRSIFAVRKIHRGEEFTESNIRIIRPGQGLAPRHWEHVLGRSASRDIDRGTPLSWELVQT